MAAFLLQVVLISLSGVMAPGPLSAAVVAHGQRSPHAGAKAALGHGVVEFPLMGLLLFGFATWDLSDGSIIRNVIALAGGAVLLFMGYGMVRSAWQQTSHAGGAASAVGSPGRSALSTGILLTGTNPYFLVWWLTVGSALLLRAPTFGWVMMPIFAITHWLCDLIWLWVLSALVYKGGRVFGAGFRRGVLLVCGVFLLAMGVDFISDGVMHQVAAVAGPAAAPD